MPDFEKQLPEWHSEGTEPPESKKNEGWQAGDKPPAQWFNWLFNRAYEALIEIRQVVSSQGDNLETHQTAGTLDHPDNSVTDAKVGNRTVDDSVANPTGNT